MKSKSSNKSFGILFFIVFILISLWPLLNGNPIRIWSIIVGILFLLISYTKPKILQPLNSAWIRLGELLGKLIAPIVMALIYFVLITPLSLIIKLFGKDLLNIKFNKKVSYWIDRKKNLSSMKKQF